MRKIFTPLALVSAATAALSASPLAIAAIFLNGQEIDSISIVTNGNDDVLVTTDGEIVEPTEETEVVDPTEETEVTPPTEPVDPNCGSVPAGVEVTNSIADWSAPGPQIRFDLNNTGSIATRFTTTAGTSFGGSIVVASTTGNSGVERRLWVSSCPGGQPLADTKCERVGTSATVLTWFQGAQSSKYCNLTPNTTYYMNVENLSCTNNACDITRKISNNGRP